MDYDNLAKKYGGQPATNEMPISEEIATEKPPLPDLNWDQRSQAWRDTVYMANELGIPEYNIDVSSGAKFLDRLDYSLADTDEEVKNKFLKKYPKGTMLRVGTEKGSRLLYKEDSTADYEQWKTVEDYGLSTKDIADLGGASIPVATSVALGLATAGYSIPVQMLAYGGGYAAGYTGKETVEAARGEQLEPLKQTAARGAKETGLTTAMAGGAGLLAKGATMAAGRGVMQRTPEVAKLMRDVQKAKQAGSQLQRLTTPQQVPESGVMARFESQARAVSKPAQRQYLGQLRSAGEEITQAKGATKSVYQAEKVVKRESERIYKSRLNTLRNEINRVSARKGSKAGLMGVKEWQQNYKNSITMSYRALDDIASREQPLFNLSQKVGDNPSVVDVAKRIKTFVLGQTEPKSVEIVKPGITVKGKEITKSRTYREMQEQPNINVAATPEGKLTGILDDITQLSDEQLDYNVLKQLRTRTGEVIEQWPWDANVNGSQAKALYASLTRAIENPTNSAPNFVRAHSRVSGNARAYYEALSSPSIRRMISQENTGQLVKTFSKPLTITDDVIDTMKSSYFPKGKLMDFKSGIKQQIVMDEKGAVNALNQMKSTDEKAWRFLVDKGEEKRLYKVAQNIDDLNNSNLAQIVNENTRQQGVIANILRTKSTQSDLQFLAKNMSPRGKEATRAAVYEDIIKKSSTEIKGVQTIDKGKLGKVIDEYKQSGLWESPLLTKNDRLRIQGLKSYMDLIMYRGKDPGTSLEAAQMITDLKHPATFFNGVHKLAVSSLMGKMLSSKMADRLLVGSGKNAFKGDPLIVTGLITKMLAEGTEAGEGPAQMPEMLPEYSQYTKRQSR